jgi:hypothetical protein
MIFLEDGKMASPISFLFLGSGKMALDICGFVIAATFPVTTWSLQRGSQMEPNVTCNLQAQNSNLL